MLAIQFRGVRPGSAALVIGIALTALGGGETQAAFAQLANTAPVAASASASTSTSTSTSTSRPVLALYGVPLKNAAAEVLITAALTAGAQRIDQRPAADQALAFDARGAGVPALQRLTVVAEGGVVASVQFIIKPYGQDNEALRRLLVQKYGLPTTTDGARRVSPTFAGRFAPRGSYEWEFAGDMTLTYRQPALGDATLTYADVAREAVRENQPEMDRIRRLKLPAAAASASAAGAVKGELGSKF